MAILSRPQYAKWVKYLGDIPSFEDEAALTADPVVSLERHMWVNPVRCVHLVESIPAYGPNRDLRRSARGCLKARINNR